MQSIRKQEIDGRERNVFKCNCGVEIYFVKWGDEFFKYEIITEIGNDEVRSKSHNNCNVVRKIETECFGCKQRINIIKNPDHQEWNQWSPKWLKENLDGTVHKHPRKKKAKVVELEEELLVN